ncbi:protein artichoke-like [Zerene cesonia]|uniref:protein artichoke-like n=1 Tax=Zerene cesonia TaxID=33412 RepID=UPI0018E4F2AC|nr:protein artichoke-like [Zerene cesonia]
MELKYILGITILCIQTAYTTNTCRLEVTTGCKYTVTCESYAGTVPNPSCEDPYVTFIVKNSFINSLTAGFFGSTNFDSRVKEIKAIGNKWTYLEESCLRYYTKTLSLDLSYNNVKYVKNLAFKSLVNLQHLNLSHNAIEDILPYSLIQYESRQTELRDIDLSYNSIRNISTGAFQYMTNLKELYLDHNEIAVLGDDIFVNLKSLNRLHLQFNNISTLSMSLINLASLEYLDLSNNNILKVNGFELNRLQNLININMSYNRLESIESNCFSQALNLNSVDLSNNKIRSDLEYVMFLNNVNLRYLDLENNNITKMQDDVFKHTILSYVNLKGNNINITISKSTFAGLVNVTELNFYNQSIMNLEENAFSSMTSLLHLNLSRNRINSIHNSSFSMDNTLLSLDLSYNNISQIDFLRYSLQNLTKLFLNNNKLTILASGLFSKQMLLKWLDVSMNKIVIIEPLSLPLKNLLYLNVSGNSLNGSVKKDTFSPAQYLTVLDISNFNLTKIEKQAFVQMPVVVRINMSHNAISDIDPDNFNETNNLYSLDISYNNLTNFDVNSNRLSRLKAVYLNNNKLRYVPNVNLSSILYLDLSYNLISNISTPIIQTYHNLKSLHLSNNMIKSFNNEFTNSLKDLYTLKLSSNDISSVNLSYFKELVSLDLSNNSLSSFYSNFFSELDYLQSLDISNNKISSLPPGIFHHLRILKLLNISSNSLSNIRYGTFNGLNRTELVDLSKNNITELDEHVFHECSELRRIILDNNHINKLDIEQLISVAPKLKSISIGGNPIACKEIVRHIKNINKTIWQVEITSIDKIFHEDNVHGIQCGDIDDESKATPTANVSSSSDSSSSVVLIWCTVLTLLVCGVIGLYFYKQYRVSSRSFGESRLQMRQSLDTSASEFQSDLLS